MISFFIVSAFIILCSYVYATRNFDYWKRRNIYSLKPLPYLGNVGPVAFLQKSIGVFLLDLYRKHRHEPYVGIFAAHKPCLIVNDYNAVENILQKDFEYFSNRMFTPSKKGDPLGSRSIFSVDGPVWKVMRAKLSPGFTPVKLKTIFEVMITVSKTLERQLNSVSRFAASDISGRYMIDIIASAAFGYDGQALNDPDRDPLRRIVKEINGSRIQALKGNAIFLLPNIVDLLSIKMLSNNAYDYMRNSVHEEIKDRTEKGTKRSDFMDMLIEQRKNGGWDLGNGKSFELEGDNIVAQFFMFMTAGHGSTSSALTFTLNELALNQDIQDKVRKEINAVIVAHGGEITYDCLKDLKYMDMVINESLRKYPPFPFIDRICTRNYKLPGTDVEITKGTYLLVSIMGLQNDDRYWEEPSKFDPERWRNPKDTIGKPYFPFSSGPRKCLGLRFGIMQLKLALIAALRNHRMTTDEKVIGFDSRRFILVADKDFYINREKIET